MKTRRITSSITNRDALSLDKYLQEINKIKLLTMDQEVLICQMINTGDQRAIDRLVKANLRFVVSVAKQYQHKGVGLGDLISEGNIGLIKAASKFDETKGFRFISFAVHWIRQSVMQAVTEQTRTVKLPFNQVYGISRTNKACSRLEQELQRSPSIAEVAEYMGVEDFKIEDYLINGRLNISLNSSLSPDKENTLMDVLKCDCPDTDANLIKSSLTENLLQLLNSLPKREAKVMRLFLGIGEQYSFHLEDIAVLLDLSKERVRQLKDKALRELKRRGKPFLSKLGIYGAGNQV